MVAGLRLAFGKSRFDAEGCAGRGRHRDHQQIPRVCKRRFQGGLTKIRLWAHSLRAVGGRSETLRYPALSLLNVPLLVRLVAAPWLACVAFVDVGPGF
jgi:hypothetical protein